ncbi:MocR-like pyridoxine biosynthesis transcription factor PdxR [Leucobacter sp. HY1908]
MDVLPHFVPDRRSPLTLTEQLTRSVRDAIATGALAPGDLLPPTRKLAAALGVSRSVAVGAYERLIGDNLVETVQGSGTRVTEAARHLVHAARGDTAQGTTAQPRDPDHRPQLAAAAIDLRSGLPYVAAEPPRAWSRALAAAARMPWAVESPEPRGTQQLRARLAAHTRLHRGLACDADDTVITSGTSEALVIVALALARVLGRSPRVVVESPGYLAGAAALAAAGAALVPLAVTERGVRQAELAALYEQAPFDALMLTPSHQFPLGGSLPAGERRSLLDWAHAHGVLVIEDDYDSEFRHDGAAMPALAAADSYGVVTYIASLNKILSPSLRCGMIALPTAGALRDALLSVREAMGATVSAHTQIALAEFIGDGAFARSVARNKREYQHRRALVLAELAGHGIRTLGGSGGLHLVISLPSAAAAERVRARLGMRGVIVETLAEFTSTGVSGSTSPVCGIVFGYGAVPVPQLMQGVQLLAETIIGLSCFDGSGIPVGDAFGQAG